MAKKEVLSEAIRILEKYNCELNFKLLKSSDSKTKNEISSEIAKNNSMILDYKFRLEYE